MGKDLCHLLKQIVLTTLLGGLCLLPLSAQADSYVEDDLQLWTPVVISGSIPPKSRLLYFLEAQPRIGNIDGQQQPGPISQLIVRGALGYRVNKHLSLWQGYAWIPTFQPTAFKENRIFQQMTLDGHIKKLRLVNRTRLEQRFIENADGASVRVRNMLLAAYPLGKSKKWAVVVHEEVFFNLNSPQGAPKAGFDQNRIFVGMNRTLSPHTSVDVGYLNNYVNRADPVPDRMGHVILVNLFVNLP